MTTHSDDANEKNSPDGRVMATAMAPAINDLLTSQEVAEWLRLSVHTLAAWRRIPGRDGPPWIDVGGSVRYPRAELDLWLSSRKKIGPASALV